VKTGGVEGTPPEWYAEGVRQALQAIVPAVRGRTPLFRRSRPLVATPVVGIGGGRLEDIGRAVRDILSLLYASAAEEEVDFALVTLGEEQYAAAQHYRQRSTDAWPALTAQQREHADRLARLAADGRLALFLGAGVSMNAGLPGWNDLLKQIAATKEAVAAGVRAEDLDQFPDVLDKASYLARRLSVPAPGATEQAADGEARLRALACDVTARDRHHYSLMHALLAALPVTQAVTTNYDRLFETAWDAAAARNPAQLRAENSDACDALPVVTSVIPMAVRPDAQRWLLKMHGCVTRPDSVVLTRESYVRYDYQWAALEGILQATLVTQYMAFVGFSLTDGNFLRILDGVRRIVRPTRASVAALGPFGTALTTTPSSAREHLFEGDLNWVSASEAQGRTEPLGVPEAARQLEVFLDYLGAKLRTTAYLLNDRYDSLLTADERRLRDGLRDLLPLVETLRRQESPAARVVEQALGRLGRTGATG
jgi:hypothetical protein